MPWLWMAEKLISPQRVVRFECYCMIGLGASAGGEAGRGSAATLLLDRVRATAGQGAAAAGVALRLEEDAAGGGGCVADPPPLKWSDLKYVLWHQGGSEHAKEETHA